ncbi:MAG: FAD-dependent oxidoreductase, partial [Clostridia bacterium]|nr:FAD-dependent oxidoreductase [Clostridia bacterium]
GGGLVIQLTRPIGGDILVGPSNEYLDDPEDYACEQDVMDMLISDGSRIFPFLKREYFIRNFSGIRPKLTSKEEGGYRDFVIERRPCAPHAINLVGIESPGLTSAVPISREIVRLMEEEEKLEKNPAFNPIRRGIVTFADKTPEQQAELIRQNPDYGEIVCRCETITKAEVLAAIHNPLGVHTVTGVKYRCRTMMGRCQGGYCQTRVAELIMQETGCSREEVLYSKDGSWLFTGKVREE